MQQLSDWDITMLSSIGALLLSFVSSEMEQQNVMTIISYLSALILCLTSVIKFIDLVRDKWKKWTKKD